MLEQYAGIIAQVFRKLSKVYDDGSGDSGNDIVCDIERILDADICAEIIEAEGSGL